MSKRKFKVIAKLCKEHDGLDTVEVLYHQPSKEFQNNYGTNWESIDTYNTSDIASDLATGVQNHDLRGSIESGDLFSIKSWIINSVAYSELEDIRNDEDIDIEIECNRFFLLDDLLHNVIEMSKLINDEALSLIIADWPNTNPYYGVFGKNQLARDCALAFAQKFPHITSWEKNMEEFGCDDWETELHNFTFEFVQRLTPNPLEDDVIKIQ